MSPGHQLRIVFVLPRPVLAGGIRTVRQLADALVARGHDVTLAHLEPHQPWPRPWRPRRFLRRLRAYVASRGLQQHHLEDSAARCICVQSDRVRAEDVPDADLVVGTWWETLEWIREWPSEKGVHVHYVQGHELHRPQDAERVREVYRQPARRIAVSSWLQRMLEEEYDQTDVALVPNGLDWEQFAMPPREPPGEPTVGVLYSPKPIKGLLTAFEAFRRLRAEEPRLRIASFGERPVDSALCPPPGLHHHVRPTQRQLPSIYARCHAWLLPSTTEGFGLPGLEAMACRTPVVATRCGGPEDYVVPAKTGYLVDVGDADAMARRLLEILRLPPQEWRAMSQAAYEAVQRFEWDASARAFEEALAPAVRTRPPA